jgi:hypothetical protein
MTDEPYAVLPAACEPIRPRLSTQQIGRLGELLVQYELLRNGIDSAPMTTDAGIDLLAYSGVKARSFTIQVKTNLTPKPGGGKGAPAIDWWVNEDCPAEFYAFVDLSTRRVWLLTKQELETSAQQRSGGRLHIYMYTNAESESVAYSRHGDARFSEFLFENRASSLFSGAPAST